MHCQKAAFFPIVQCNVLSAHYQHKSQLFKSNGKSINNRYGFFPTSLIIYRKFCSFCSFCIILLYFSLSFFVHWQSEKSVVIACIISKSSERERKLLSASSAVLLPKGALKSGRRRVGLLLPLPAERRLCSSGRKIKTIIILALVFCPCPLLLENTSKSRDDGFFFHHFSLKRFRDRDMR